MQSCTERLGGQSLSLNDVPPLNHAITQSNLLQIPMTGAYYTWNNNSRSGLRTYSKLDRSYYNHLALSLWPQLVSHFQYPSISDHSPIILTWGLAVEKGPSYFHFFNPWTKDTDFLNIVQQLWRERVYGNPMYIL